MTGTLKFLLSAHVILGLLGIILFAAVGLGLLRERLSLKSLRKQSLWGTVFFVLSWLTGGYYYVAYYGKAVRGVIKAGQYPWAHSVFMEAKEHIFLFLPFLALAVVAGLSTLLGEKRDGDAWLRGQLSFVTGVIVVLGILITLSGVVISGAVR